MGVKNLKKGSNWKVVEQSAFDLPSGYAATLKISRHKEEDRISVSLAAGKFFFPFNEIDLDRFIDVLQFASDRVSSIKSGAEIIGGLGEYLAETETNK